MNDAGSIHAAGGRYSADWRGIGCVHNQAWDPAALVDEVDFVDVVDIAPAFTLSTLSTPSTLNGASCLGEVVWYISRAFSR